MAKKTTPYSLTISFHETSSTSVVFNLVYTATQYSAVHYNPIIPI